MVGGVGFVKSTDGSWLCTMLALCHVFTRRLLGVHTDRKTVVFFFLRYPSSLISWMFEHNCLDTCCFGCLLCMCFVLHLFSAFEHVSHGKAL